MRGCGLLGQLVLDVWRCAVFENPVVNISLNVFVVLITFRTGCVCVGVIPVGVVLRGAIILAGSAINQSYG